MNIIERFTNPSKHVQEPYGTIVRNGKSYFIQVSQDPETSNWVTFGELLSVVHLDSIKDDDFIANALRVYATKIAQPTGLIDNTRVELEEGV
jgi:hypothetical protein